MNRGFLLLFILILPAWVFAGDSTRFYQWLRKDLAYIQFHNRSAVQNLTTNWKEGSRYVVAHFGDSHVQPDIITSELRKAIQLYKGDGGRGMVFPYTAARTHPAFDYSTRYTGIWMYARNTDPRPRLPLGATGVTIRTTDPSATFTINFRNGLSDKNKKLLVYCRRAAESFDLELRTTNGVEEIKVFEEGPTSSPVEISLPAFGGSLTIKVKKNSEQQREFELYGLSFESEETSGAIVHSLGISGAPYASLLIESLLEEQLIHLNPNLVILDLGTNDYIPGNRIPMDMEIKITDVIRKIRRAVPHADILLTTTQDMNRRGINMSAGRSLSLLIREIARKEDCAFFDWYWVSGGPKTMSYWVNQGLAQKDNIHLTHAGYTLKGRLLATAFMKTVKKLEEEPGLQSLILNTDSIPLPLQTLRDSLRNVPAPPQNYYRPIASEVPSGKLITHTIKSGESLGSIAEKYGVSITSIRELNGIYGSKIIAGKTLKVIVKNNAPTSAVSKNGTPKDSQQLLKNTLPHKISSGETLFSIAEKYKVTVEELKKLNRLPNSRIVAGETLYIPLPSTEDKRNKS